MGGGNAAFLICTRNGPSQVKLVDFVFNFKAIHQTLRQSYPFAGGCATVLSQNTPARTQSLT